MLIAIIVILGLIIAGGFLIYFIGDSILSASGKRDDEIVRKNQEREKDALQQEVDALANPEAVLNDPAVAAILYNGGSIEAYDPEAEDQANEEVAQEEAEAQEEKDELEQIDEEIDELLADMPADEVAEESNEEVAEEANEEPIGESIEKVREEDEDDYIEKRRKELMERLAKMQEDSDDEEEDDSVVSIEDSEETNEEVSAEEVVEEVAEEVAEEPVEDVAEEETPVEEIAEVVEETPSTLSATYTIEELEAQLVDAQEKLKSNEKELRQCKKEFIPLRKVKKTLERDEEKLRRKDALVAKQKVVLYGVNNYADIDEEKAKKLEEDLDLLEGLKLSVQHCKEVMDANEERYPLLEKIFNLLSSQNTEIKDDIARIEKAIEELKAQGSDEE